MNKVYVLNNSFDTSLYHANKSTDTRSVNEAKSFATRKLAENYMSRMKLSESYSVKLVMPRMQVTKVVSESIDSESSKKMIYGEIQSAIDDTKDIIETTIDLISMYQSDLSEDISLEGSNIEDVLDRLKKMSKYANGIAFRPSFDNSLNDPDIEDPKNDDNTGGDLNGE